MIIYKTKPVYYDNLQSEMPSYIDSFELICNQAYYSMMLLKKNAKNLKEASKLRSIAAIYGNPTRTITIKEILDTTDMNELGAVLVGRSYTSRNIEELRSEFHRRLDTINWGRKQLTGSIYYNPFGQC